MAGNTMTNEEMLAFAGKAINAFTERQYTGFEKEAEALTRLLAVGKVAVEKKSALDTNIRNAVLLTSGEWTLFAFLQGALNEELQTGKGITLQEYREWLEGQRDFWLQVHNSSLRHDAEGIRLFGYAPSEEPRKMASVFEVALRKLDEVKIE